MRGSFWLVLILLACTSLACADTTWVAAGNVSGTWTATNSPYMIQGHINVPTDSSLTIGPGVRVYFTGPYSLRADSAQFSALGTATDSIIFTTDTLLNPQRWRGFHLRFMRPDTIQFRYCVVENMDADTAEFSWGSFERSDVSFSHCAIRNNRSAQSAFTVLFSNLLLDSCNIRDNQCPWSVFYIAGNDIDFAGCEGIANSGGLFWIDLADRLRLTNCRFSGNSSSRGGVGVALADSNEISGCVFEDNYASWDGGALAFSQFTASLIENCRFFGNWTSGFGGALSFYGGTATIHDCEFAHDSAAYGGAIGSTEIEFTARLRVERCRFTSNQATTIGGVYAGGAMTTWTQCVFDSNAAPRSGVIDAYFGSAAIDHCTFVANHAADSSAIVSWYSEYAQMGPWSSLRNSICAFNTGGPVMKADLYYADSLGHSIPGDSLHHNLFFGNTGGNFSQGSLGLDSNLTVNANGDSCDAFHNLYLDPRFVDLAAGDYHLLDSSPCIDAGDPASPPDSDGTVADIGAFSSPYLPDAVDDPLILQPSAFILSAYPNPFNATTVLSYDIPQAASVTLKLYNLLGEEVAMLVNSTIQPGRYRTRWNAAEFSSGTYLAVLQTGDHRFVQKLLLLK